MTIEEAILTENCIFKITNIEQFDILYSLVKKLILNIKEYEWENLKIGISYSIEKNKTIGIRLHKGSYYNITYIKRDSIDFYIKEGYTLFFDINQYNNDEIIEF